MLFTEDSVLHFRYDAEHLQIEPWGPNAFRIRSTQTQRLSDQDWALSEKVPDLKPVISVAPLNQQPSLPAPGTYITESPKQCPPATIENGNIVASITPLGKVSITNRSTGKCILEEYTRNRLDLLDPKTSALEISAREWASHGTGTEQYHLTYRLESQDPNEKIYGMGQYQQPYLDLKGLDLELAQRNSQASVPFLVSSLGYGLLWNNPSVGRAVLGKNIMSFEAHATTTLDYWIVCPSSGEPRDILSAYADVTGHSPDMPEYGLGFWQCKLRYQTQHELLEVAREHKIRRKLPLSVIVVDFFHWPCQGEWKFDPNFWPDPAGMIRELTDMGVKLLVSIWPTVDKRSENYSEMMERGFLIRTESGIRIAMDFQGNTVHADFTNPAARQYVWDIAKKNYFDHGVRTFWLDEAEPEYSVYSFGNYRYHLGTNLSIGNVYPVKYAQAFYEGQLAAGQPQGEICNLLRCAWAGSQRFGTLVWSGDIASSWSSFRNQFYAGLNMGMAGIPWWTTDIGGFHGGRTEDPAFRELLVRWFQWGAFCPVMRLHGSREPIQPKVGEGGGSECRSGAANEVWSFGDQNYPILVKYLRLRERMKAYIKRTMQQASTRGWPVIRTMFFEFPNDPRCWSQEIEGLAQYMFGDTYLVAPVMEPSLKKRTVYLPGNTKWAQLKISEDRDDLGPELEGGRTVDVDLVGLEDIPVFVKIDK